MTINEHIYNQDPAIDTMGRFLFFCNSKVATQSTVRGILKGRVITSLITPRKYKKIIMAYSMSDIQNMFKFTIVRNPWDKVVSRFFYVKQHKYKKLKKYKNETFESFVKKRLFIKEHDLQYDKVFYNGSIFIDFIGRFERLKDDWKIIASIIDCSADLPHDNKTEREPYRNYYNRETRNIVADAYRKDIETFGYSF
jgi:hypothetical protein